MNKDPKVQAVYQLPRVKVFLDRKGKNSKSTFIAYRSALVKLNDYLAENMEGHNCQTIVDLLLEKKTDVYELLDNFVSYLEGVKTGITTETVRNYIDAVKSYFGKYDIDIVPSKFKHRVELPKNQKIKKYALDPEDIRKVLAGCNNIRLKAWISVLASSGIRAQREACSIRYKDIDFSSSPTAITLRAKFTKTKTERIIYISDEATKFLKQWIEFKQNHREYVNQGRKVTKRSITPEDFVFRANDTPNQVIDTDRSIHNIYVAIHDEFVELLNRIGLGDKREGSRRGIIVPHDLRTFVYTVVEEQVNTGYAEYLLGHAGSTYHAEKENKIRQTYKDKCMKYLQFLDFPTIQSVGKSFEAQMQEKDTQIAELKGYINKYTDIVRNYREEMGEYQAIEKRWIQDRKENDELKDRVGELSEIVGKYSEQIEAIKPLLDAGIYWKKKVKA